MLRAVVKNTFLSIQAEDEAIASRLFALNGSFERAKSADAVLITKSCDETSDDDGQLYRLNNLISLDTEELRPSDKDRSPARDALEASEAPSVDELRQLQRKLSATMMRTDHKRVMSNSSISTMADGEGLGGLRPVWSSASLNTMVSDFCDEDEALLDSSLTQLDRLQDFSHGRVPKNFNLAEEFNKVEHEGPPTTMMIRNIPNRYTQRELIRELETLGFGGTFDFLYVPIDKGTMCNVGYAFVNFIHHQEATRCMTVFDNYSFAKHRKARGKIATVSVAHIQGLEANIRHYENAAVNGSARSRQRGPVVMASIAKSLCSDVAAQ